MSKPEGDIRYDYDEVLELSKKALKENNLTMVEDIAAFLPCSLRTFYNYKLHELQELKDLITVNKIKMKQGLKKRWFDDGSSSERIALYKLLGTQDERDALNGKTEENKNNEIRVVIDRGIIESRDDIND